MEAKWIEVSTLVLAGFKKTEILKQLNVSRMTAHRSEQRLKALESIEGSSSIRKVSDYKPRPIKKAFEKRLMLENDKDGAEEEYFSLPSVQDGQKYGRKCLRRFRNHLLSAAIFQKFLERSTRLLNDLKNHGIRAFIFFRRENFHRWSRLQ